MDIQWNGLERFPELKHRVTRSISWLDRAREEDDVDTQCILLWIAFNAAYAIDLKAARSDFGESPREHELRKIFFDKLTRQEFGQVHHTATDMLWNRIVKLISNEYVFWGFWESLTEKPFNWDDWRLQSRFESDKQEVMRCLKRPSPNIA